MAVIWNDDSKTDDRKTGKSKLVIVMITIVVIAGVAGFLLFGGVDWINNTTGEVVPETTAPQIAFSDDPAAISAASQSVVKLNCYDKNGDLYATGSGFACFADDVIVTNYHVIEGGVYSIEASTEDGRTFDIQYVLVADEDKDIAILSTATPHNLTLLKPGESGILQKGEKVVAIGSPLGLLNSVSTGVFSGYVDENGMDVLQFTASISSGSSGGALFNDAGEVLGITFASYEAGQNLNLAVPITEAERIWKNSHYTNKLTIKAFYNTQIRTYPIEYIILNWQELLGEEFYVEGWVLSHNTVQYATTKEWRSWCTIYSSPDYFPTTNDSSSLSTDWQINGYDTIGLEVAVLSMRPVEEIVGMRTGDYIRVKATINKNESTIGYFVSLNLETIDILG